MVSLWCMDVIDERIFLEEIARRVNDFFRDFPEEASRLFGDPQAFGSEVATMLETLFGENVEVPFGVLFTSVLSGPGENPTYSLAMVYEDDELQGFEVIEANKINRDSSSN